MRNSEISSYENVILKIHDLILRGINDEERGKYRNVRVRIAGSDAILPNPLKIPDLMHDFCSRLDNKEDSVLKAIEAHYELVEIHPFVDGNGRTARLLMTLILLRSNVIPIIIQPIERKRYLKSISLRNTKGKKFQYYQYMLKQLLKTITVFETSFGDKIENRKDLLKISEFAELCGVPISTIRYYLRIGKITPTGRTDAGYMLFSKEQKELI